MQWLCKTWRPDGVKVIHAKTHLAEETRRSLPKFLRPEEHPRSTCTDKSLASIKAREELDWNHERCTPHRSETTGIEERAVRRVKEGTSSVLVQSGTYRKLVGRSSGMSLLSPLADGQTPYERRFNTHKVECISSAHKSYLEYSWDTA